MRLHGPGGSPIAEMPLFRSARQGRFSFTTSAERLRIIFELLHMERNGYRAFVLLREKRPMTEPWAETRRAARGGAVSRRGMVRGSRSI